MSGRLRGVMEITEYIDKRKRPVPVVRKIHRAWVSCPPIGTIIESRLTGKRYTTTESSPFILFGFGGDCKTVDLGYLCRNYRFADGRNILSRTIEDYWPEMMYEPIKVESLPLEEHLRGVVFDKDYDPIKEPTLNGQPFELYDWGSIHTTSSWVLYRVDTFERRDDRSFEAVSSELFGRLYFVQDSFADKGVYSIEEVEFPLQEKYVITSKESL